jgi:pimeloyl-ACP methyl ester carboxylesterase
MPEAALGPLDWYRHLGTCGVADLLVRDRERATELLHDVLGDDEADDLVADLDAEEESPAAVDPELPEIVWLPGILGSHLTLDGARRRHVWLDGWSLATLSLADLLALRADGVTDAAGRGTVVPDGLVGLIYDKGPRKWRRGGFVVHEVAYDWRKSLAHAAERLHLYLQALQRERPRRLVLVGHSMGGVVAAMWGALHPRDLEPVDRAVLLGAPLGGTFAPIRALNGTFPPVRKVAAVSPRDTLDELVAAGRTFAGMIDMLPSPDVFEGVERVYDAGQWAPGRAPSSRWLRQSLEVKHKLANSPLLERAVSVVTARFATVGSLVPDVPIQAGARTAAGDGTVTLSSQVVAGVPAVLAQRRHAELPLEPAVLGAVASLAMHGRCELPAVDVDADYTTTLDDGVPLVGGPELPTTLRALRWLLADDA